MSSICWGTGCRGNRTEELLIFIPADDGRNTVPLISLSSLRRAVYLVIHCYLRITISQPWTEKQLVSVTTLFALTLIIWWYLISMGSYEKIWLGVFFDLLTGRLIAPYSKYYSWAIVTLRCLEGLTLHWRTQICWHCGSFRSRRKSGEAGSLFYSSPKYHGYVVQDFSYISLGWKRIAFSLANWMHDMFCDGALGVRIVGISLVVRASMTVGYVAFTNAGEEWFGRIRVSHWYDSVSNHRDAYYATWPLSDEWLGAKDFVCESSKTTRWILKQDFYSWLVIYTVVSLIIHTPRQKARSMSSVTSSSKIHCMRHSKVNLSSFLLNSFRSMLGMCYEGGDCKMSFVGNWYVFR